MQAQTQALSGTLAIKLLLGAWASVRIILTWPEAWTFGVG
jgi:hypothetical protein